MAGAFFLCMSLRGAKRRGNLSDGLRRPERSEGSPSIVREVGWVPESGGCRMKKPNNTIVSKTCRVFRPDKIGTQNTDLRSYPGNKNVLHLYSIKQTVKYSIVRIDLF
jgi:hypothetical protein